MLKDMKQWCLSHSHESAKGNHLEIAREGISLGKIENKVNTTYKYTKLLKKSNYDVIPYSVIFLFPSFTLYVFDSNSFFSTLFSDTFVLFYLTGFMLRWHPFY